MALQVTVTEKDNFGIEVTLNNTYCKVSSVIADKETATAIVSFLSGQNGSTYKKKEYNFTPDLDGSNFIKQAYNHLKTLPEFSDATDV